MTVREAIAWAAASAITEVDGVAGPSLERGTSLVGGRIPGVVCAAAARGGYDVTLYVTARPVPLMALGERLVARATDAVSEAGHGEDLGAVRVVVLDIVEPA